MTSGRLVKVPDTNGTTTREGAVGLSTEQRAELLADLADWFGELDDTEDPRFGEYAQVSIIDSHTILVGHQSESWGIEVTIKQVDL